MAPLKRIHKGIRPSGTLDGKAEVEIIIEVKLDLKDVSATLKWLLHSTMLLYFTNKAPSAIPIKNWVEEEFQEQNGWPMEQVKLVGNNFFLFAFTNKGDRDTTLHATP